MISNAACDAAAAWWAHAMERPKFDALGGQRDAMMELTQMTMSVIAAKNRATPEQLATFRETLAARLRHEVKSLSSPRLVVGVDYHPDPILDDAAQAAGLGELPCAFPIKTVMWLNDKSVQVRHGYGATIQTIYCETSLKSVEVPHAGE